MLRPLGRHILARSPQAWLLGWTMSLCALPAAATSAELSLPASGRACTAENDPGRRLACYDREVARYQEPKADNQGAPPASASNVAMPSSDGQLKLAQAQTAKKTGHLSARVISLERTANEMTLHLDNGQIWQEMQSTSGNLSLHAGDTIEIDKHFGSYWLRGPHVSGMKVRQKT